MVDEHTFRKVYRRKDVRHFLEGFAVITLTAPLERIKILMQVEEILPLFNKQLKSPPRISPSFVFSISYMICSVLASIGLRVFSQVSSASKRITSVGGYRVMRQCFSHCCYHQGYASLWRGYTASLITHFPTIIMAQQLGPWFRSGVNKRDRWRYFRANVFSGAASGAIAVSLFYPLHFCRTRLAADIGKTRSDREFTSLWNCAKTIVKQDGIRGLYRGLFISLQGIILHRALYFGIYDTWNGWAVHHTRKNFVASFFAGQCLILFCRLVTYPFELLPRQMQMQSGNNHRLFENALQCIKTIAAKEGIRGFYRGILPALIHGGITSAAYIFLSFVSRN